MTRSYLTHFVEVDAQDLYLKLFNNVNKNNKVNMSQIRKRINLRISPHKNYRFGQLKNNNVTATINFFLRYELKCLKIRIYLGELPSTICIHNLKSKAKYLSLNLKINRFCGIIQTILSLMKTKKQG